MQVALAHLADGEQRVEIDQCRHLGACQDGAAALDGNPVDEAVVGCVYLVLGKLGLGALQLRLGGGEPGAGLVGLQLGRVAACHQPLGGIGFGLPLRDHAFGHPDRRFLVLGVQAHHQVAALDALALLHRQALDDAHDAGGERDALLRLGVAGDADGARMHQRAAA